MKVSKHDPDGYYCPKVIGAHPQSGEKMYCVHTAKAIPVAALLATPAPPPATTGVQPTIPVAQPPPPVRYANGNGERGLLGRQLFIQWSVRTAAHVLGMKNELPPTMKDVREYAVSLRQLVREELTGKKHWIADEKTRARFWAWLGDQGLNSKDAHEALGVGSVYDFEGTKEDAVKLINAYVGAS